MKPRQDPALPQRPDALQTRGRRDLVPVFGVIGAVVINGESVRPAQAVGGAVIIAGVALGMIERGRRATAKPGVAVPAAPGVTGGAR